MRNESVFIYAHRTDRRIIYLENSLQIPLRGFKEAISKML